MGIGINNSQPAKFTLVAQKNFASNAVEWTGLSGDYRYLLYLPMTVVDLTQAHIEINADTTETHYNCQFFEVIGAVFAGAQYNVNYATSMGAAGNWYVIVDIARDSGGYVHYQTKRSGRSGAMVFESIYGGKTDATITEITSIKILKKAVGTSINGTATLYKLGV